MSDINVTRQNNSSANVQSQLGSELLQANRGERYGRSVDVVNKNSDLSDIQEEIGNAVGKFADKKTLGQAKLRQGAGVNIEALKRIADYYDKLPDMPRDAELRDLVGKLQGFEDLMQRGESASEDDILEALSQFDGDVTHQYEALQTTRRYFEETGASDEFLALLESAGRYFDDPDIQRDVQAGYTIGPSASAAAPTLETSPAALRDTYREMLRGDKPMGQLFDLLSGFNLRQKFDETIDVFLKAAGRELANSSSQADPVLIGHLTRELATLKEMRTVMEQGEHLIHQTKRIDPSFAQGTEGASAKTLTSRLLNFAAKPSPSMTDTRQLIKNFDGTGEQTLVVFANGLHDLHRLISDRSVISDSARLQQSAMLKNLRIELSAAEEAAFDANAR